MPESDDIRAEDARTAAEFDADVGMERIGEVYAEALLGAAEQTAAAEDVLEELGTLVTGVLDRFPKFEAVLASGLISQDEKSGIIDRTLSGRASPLLVNFLKVVAAHGRLDCLRAIHRQARLLLDERAGRVHVTLTTAVPVDATAAFRIAERIHKIVDAEAVVTQRVDPELIGGAVLRVGDTVYDGSIANQLKNVRKQMLDRSAHEIQSRRDRFRYSAGN